MKNLQIGNGDARAFLYIYNKIFLSESPCTWSLKLNKNASESTGWNTLSSLSNYRLKNK